MPSLLAINHYPLSIKYDIMSLSPEGGWRGEWWSAKLASPAWELYGRRGLVAESFPKPDVPQQEGCVSYHIRTGIHNLTPYDWDRYMDFADRHGWRK